MILKDPSKILSNVQLDQYTKLSKSARHHRHLVLSRLHCTHVMAKDHTLGIQQLQNIALFIESYK